MLRDMNRRDFIANAALTAASVALSQYAPAQDSDLAPIWSEIQKRHDESVQRVQTWIRQQDARGRMAAGSLGCRPENSIVQPTKEKAYVE